MANTIGMTDSILHLIEKRGKADMIIFCVLVLVTILLIYGLIVYVKPMLFGSSVATKSVEYATMWICIN